jgi:hypothetical protein
MISKRKPSKKLNLIKAIKATKIISLRTFAELKKCRNQHKEVVHPNNNTIVIEILIFRTTLIALLIALAK